MGRPRPSRSPRLGEVFAGPVDVLFAEGDYLEPDVLRRHGVPEYWVVDRDAGTIERWRFAAPSEADLPRPETLQPGDTLRWVPVEGAEAVALDVAGILAA